MKKAMSIFAVVAFIITMFAPICVSQINPDYQLAQEINHNRVIAQMANLDEIIWDMSRMPFFDQFKPHTKWEKKNWHSSDLRGKFLIAKLDSVGILHGSIYNVSIILNNKTSKIILFAFSTLQNGVWTDVTYLPGTDPHLRVVSYCINEPFNILGLIPWNMQDFLCKFGGINGLDVKKPVPHSIWARELDLIPENMINDLEKQPVQITL